MAKTLDELKAENAAIELAETEQAEVITPNTIAEAEAEEVEINEADVEFDEIGESSQEEALEPWMQTESEDNETVPVSVLAKVRGKLKGTVREQNSEIEQLKAEIEKLKTPNQPQSQQQVNQIPPRPTREDFDYDDDKYDAAVDEWQMKRFQAAQAQQQQQSQVSQQQQAQIEQINQAASSHYDRAQKLVESGTVSADEYNKADTNVRMMFEQVYPNSGDQTTDAIIAQLSSVGEGSEKVMYYLGKNPTALNELKNKITLDPSGMQAMVYLGTLQAKVTQSPTKKVSQAPKPATELKGEENTSPASKPMHKKYAAAHKSGNSQEAFNIKREARQKGIDTKSW